MRRFVRENSLSIVFGVLFLAALAGQAVAGHRAYNEDQLAHHGQTISLSRYVVSSSFGRAVLENWQSEYLQFALYIVVTVWLVQRGAADSKRMEEAGPGSDEEQKLGRFAQERSPLFARIGGPLTRVYANSLGLLMVVIFALSLFGQSVSGWSEYNADQIEHHEAELSYGGYLGSAHFWEDVLQNWQSEFLAVGSMTVFGIYLRQRGSPESKPVGEPHDVTGTGV